MFICNQEEFLNLVKRKILKTGDKYQFNCKKCGKESETVRHGPLNEFSFLCSKCKREIRHLKNKNNENVIFVNNENHLKKLKEEKIVKFWQRYSFICIDCGKKSYRTISTSIIDYKNFLCHGCSSKRTYLKNLGVSNPMYLESTKNSINETCLKKYNCRWATQSQQHKDKTRKTNLQKYNGGWPSSDKKIRDKIRDTFLKHYNNPTYAGSEDWRNHLSEISKKSSKRYIYNNIKFDSAPEVALFIYLKDNNITFQYHPDDVFYYEYHNKTYSYYPDFKVNDELWEIKGDQFFDENDNLIDPFDSDNNEKCKCKQICMESNNIKILRSKDYQIYLDYVSNKYGKKYILKMKQY